MTHEAPRFLELLERRTALLDSLAATLTAASADVVSLDIDGLESRIADQERACIDIRSLDADLDRVQRRCAAQLGVAAEQEVALGLPSDGQRMQETLQRLRAAQARVQQLNDAHQALLRRSRRTVGALLNSLQSFAMTYSESSASRFPAGEGI